MDKKLKSEQVVLSAPMSFNGSAARIWKITRGSDDRVSKTLLSVIALTAIFFIWIAVAFWYVAFGILLIPYRLIRRGQRRRKMESLRHRELLEVVQNKS